MTDLATSISIAIMDTRSCRMMQQRHINCCAIHMITKCHKIIKAVGSKKAMRQIPLSLRHPNAQKNAIAEFKRAMENRVIPMIESIIIEKKRSDVHALYLESGGGLNYPSYTCTGKLCEILGGLIRKYAIDNMHIIERIHELDIFPQSLLWFNEALTSIRRLGDWDMICEDSEHCLLQHSLLPHPDFFLHVIKRSINHNESWASVVSSPPLMIDKGHPNLIRLMDICHDITPRSVEECRRSSSMKRDHNVSIIFDETFDRAIDIAEIM